MGKTVLLGDGSGSHGWGMGGFLRTVGGGGEDPQAEGGSKGGAMGKFAVVGCFLRENVV